MSVKFWIIFFDIILVVQSRHFNGGTINWAAIDPYTNDSLINITITQSYSWTYPVVKCLSPVPGASGFGNSRLICVVDCDTNGGYNSTPITIATDCISVNSALKMMSSERTNTITLAKDAHFYLANVGNAWIALNDPRISGLEWSIVTFIDLRKRPDGFINTPPVARVVSPQYVFVNTTMTIKIPVSDANAGDDIRCRWSKYTSGYRRRKRSSDDESPVHHSVLDFYQKLESNWEILKRQDPSYTEKILNREKRNGHNSCNNCPSSCIQYCCCNSSSLACDSDLCSGQRCWRDEGCVKTTTTTRTTTTTTTRTTTTTTTRTTTTTTTRTTTTTTRTTTTTTTTAETTTPETSATMKSTLSYATRQAIDECGGICYPGSLPSNTTLSDCTVTITAPKVGIWYGVAIQVIKSITSNSHLSASCVVGRRFHR